MQRKGVKKWLGNNLNMYQVIIYGAGIYGRLTYDLLSKYKNINITGWVDRDYKKIEKDKYPISISNPDIITKLPFDYIIIAVTTERFIIEICNDINIKGVKNQQIIFIDENEFNQLKKINLFEDKNIEIFKKNWNDYIYLRNKYEHFVELRNKEEGTDSGITWLLWLQGWENAPEIVKRCRDSIKKFVKNRKIVFLDEENCIEYIDIPEDIREMYKNGIINNTHYSDIIRLELLKEYGGLWLDSTIFLTDYLEDYITKGSIFVFQFPENSDARTISNWLMYAHSKNILIEETLKLLYRYWRTEKKVLNYYVMHFLFRIVCNIYYEEWKKVPYFLKSSCNIMEKELNNEYNKERMEQILKMSKIHKLSYKQCFNRKNSIYNYILNNIL